ncbi:3-hydroxyacyl- nad binding protein [Penicillium sp. IBT 35674x]|nr:3-hydroxyacyl- nad binding protein [Penicillium sp. IBT 35674x]
MRSPWIRPQIGERTVAILGAGVLGRRVALVWSAGGFTVCLRDPEESQRIAALQYVHENSPEAEKRTGKLPGQVQAVETLEEAVKNAWLVIEAVPESLQLNIDTFGQLDALVMDDCILCSNLSAHKTSDMLALVKTENHRRILNMHYYLPPEMRVVELMTDGYTEPAIFSFPEEVLRDIGMLPIMVQKESTGFLFNRIWAAVKRECLNVLADGVASHHDIDTIWLGDKSEHGGLYPKAAEPQLNHPQGCIYFLDLGTGCRRDPLSSGRVLRANIDGKDIQTLISGQKLPDGLVIDNPGRRLYWTCMGSIGAFDGEVHSCNLEGQDVRTIVPSGKVHTPKQIFIHRKSRKLYFCDREGLRVMRCNLDGSAFETVVQTGH